MASELRSFSCSPIVIRIEGFCGGKWWKTYGFKPQQMSIWLSLKWELASLLSFEKRPSGFYEYVLCGINHIFKIFFQAKMPTWIVLHPLKREAISMKSSPTRDNEEPHIPQKVFATCYSVFWMYLCDKTYLPLLDSIPPANSFIPGSYKVSTSSVI